MTDDGAEDVLRQVEQIMDDAGADVSLETFTKLLAKVGGMLSAWHDTMRGIGFSERWVEETSMILFNKFFGPKYVQETFEDDDDD